jgi:hypothetical protein
MTSRAGIDVKSKISWANPTGPLRLPLDPVHTES